MAIKKRARSKSRPAAKKHSARKRPAMAKRGSAARGYVKRRQGRSARPMSAFATRVLAVFTSGVEHQLETLAKNRVPTVAIVDGKEVRGVPRKVNGKYVLVAPKG